MDEQRIVMLCFFKKVNFNLKIFILLRSNVSIPAKVAHQINSQSMILAEDPDVNICDVITTSICE